MYSRLYFESAIKIVPSVCFKYESNLINAGDQGQESALLLQQIDQDRLERRRYVFRKEGPKILFGSAHRDFRTREHAERHRHSRRSGYVHVRGKKRDF